MGESLMERRRVMDETAHTPTGGCSQEHSTMGESLMERRRVMDEVLRDVNIFCEGRNRRKADLTVPQE